MPHRSPYTFRKFTSKFFKNSSPKLKPKAKNLSTVPSSIPLLVPLPKQSTRPQLPDFSSPPQPATISSLPSHGRNQSPRYCMRSSSDGAAVLDSRDFKRTVGYSSGRSQVSKASRVPVPLVHTSRVDGQADESSTIKLSSASNVPKPCVGAPSACALTPTSSHDSRTKRSQITTTCSMPSSQVPPVPSTTVAPTLRHSAIQPKRLDDPSKTESSSTKSHISTLQLENSNLKTQNSALKKENSNLKEENPQLITKNLSLTQKKASLENKNAELDREAITLKTTISNLQSDILSCDGQLSVLRSELYMECIQKNAYRKDRERYKTETQLLEEKLKQTQKFIEAMINLDLHVPVLYGAAEAVRDGAKAEEAIIEAIKAAASKEHSVWSRIVPAITGPRTAEHYIAAIHLFAKAQEKLNRSQSKLNFWKKQAKMFPENENTITPSPSNLSVIREEREAYDESQTLLDDLLACLERDNAVSVPSSTAKDDVNDIHAVPDLPRQVDDAPPSLDIVNAAEDGVINEQSNTIDSPRLPFANLNQNTTSIPQAPSRKASDSRSRKKGQSLKENVAPLNVSRSRSSGRRPPTPSRGLRNGGASEHLPCEQEATRNFLLKSPDVFYDPVSPATAAMHKASTINYSVPWPVNYSSPFTSPLATPIPRTSMVFTEPLRSDEPSEFHPASEVLFSCSDVFHDGLKEEACCASADATVPDARLSSIATASNGISFSMIPRPALKHPRPLPIPPLPVPSKSADYTPSRKITSLTPISQSRPIKPITREASSLSTRTSTVPYDI